MNKLIVAKYYLLCLMLSSDVVVGEIPAKRIVTQDDSGFCLPTVESRSKVLTDATNEVDRAYKDLKRKFKNPSQEDTAGYACPRVINMLDRV